MRSNPPPPGGGGRRNLTEGAAAMSLNSRDTRFREASHSSPSVAFGATSPSRGRIVEAAASLFVRTPEIGPHVILAKRRTEPRRALVEMSASDPIEVV